MDDVWTVSASEAGKVELTLRAGPPRPLVATLTEAEMSGVETVLPRVADVVRRGEFSRIQLGKAFHQAIGRDPFKQVKATPPAESGGWLAWWGNLGFLVIGLGNALSDRHSLWWRILAVPVAVYALTNLAKLAKLAWRRHRR